MIRRDSLQQGGVIKCYNQIAIWALGDKSTSLILLRSPQAQVICQLNNLPPHQFGNKELLDCIIMGFNKATQETGVLTLHLYKGGAEGIRTN